MTKAHHTLGPWFICHEKREFDNAYWIGPERHFTIAKVEHGAEDEEYGGAEAELANANLVAASPQLLAACKAQHRAIDFLFAMLIDLSTTFLPSKSGIAWEAITLGNQAIRKAEPQ